MNITKQTNTHMPNVMADTLMLQVNQKDSPEDWEELVSAMFEWVEMAALGSQRLSAGDHCNPCILVYVPPDPSQVGNLTQIFVSVTVHAVPTSPVTHILDDLRVKGHPSLCAPRVDAEDTIPLVYMRGEDVAGQAVCSWLLAESIGRWDKRWG
ncbi:hypothetical protein BD310DRAFT_950031 [Dichomitus squalens]|uniref:Uncharacterized protein n=1 Tax=Dichomitus squalens TaxID=114155 RepID=A0A4Q9PQJ2_9APHY|nr:hypothetical protein BD310DRAFT_950031 [Dichomitus squalens]